jgi:parallel beta-helix repeat protein
MMKKIDLTAGLCGIFFVIALVACNLCFVGVASANFSYSPTELPYIYITPTGEITPQTSEIQCIGDTYRFSNDLYNRTLAIQKSNVVIDAAGYALVGNGVGKGIVISDVSNVTIKNAVLKNLAEGFLCQNSSNFSITENIIQECNVGIHLISTQNVAINANRIAKSLSAIEVFGSNVVSIMGNQILESKHKGITLNLGQHDMPNCNNISVLANNITLNLETGVELFSCSNSRIEGNLITGSQNGIYLHGSLKQNNIANNTIMNNNVGLSLVSDASFNTVTGNYIADNKYGIYILESSNNLFYNNNLIDNQRNANIDSPTDIDDSPQAPFFVSEISVNTWDNGLKETIGTTTQVLMLTQTA